MGTYTQFHFASEIKKDTPKEVIEILTYMTSYEVEPKKLPNHKFFKCERWKMLFRMDSYYFPATTHCDLRLDEITNSYFLTVTSNLKNYDEEIDKFVDWITPHIEAFEGDFLGYSRHEETEDPKLIHF